MYPYTVLTSTKYGLISYFKIALAEWVENPSLFGFHFIPKINALDHSATAPHLVNYCIFSFPPMLLTALVMLSSAQNFVKPENQTSFN